MASAVGEMVEDGEQSNDSSEDQIMEDIMGNIRRLTKETFSIDDDTMQMKYDQEKTDHNASLRVESAERNGISVVGNQVGKEVAEGSNAKDVERNRLENAVEVKSTESVEASGGNRRGRRLRRNNNYRISEVSYECVEAGKSSENLEEEESMKVDEPECVLSEESHSVSSEVSDSDKHETGENSMSAEESGVECISHTSPVFFYTPLTSGARDYLCSLLNIVNEYEGKDVQTPSELGEILDSHTVRADNDSLFRAISYAISGTEKNHRKIRLAVVKHVLSKEEKFEPFLLPPYSTVPEYVLQSGIKYLGVQPTDLEICGVADFLKTDVYVLDDDWTQFSRSEKSGRHAPAKRGIYLRHLGQSHYEVVLKMGSQSENTENENSQPSERALTESSESDALCTLSEVLGSSSEALSTETPGKPAIQEGEAKKRNQKRSLQLTRKEHSAKKRKAAFNKYWSDESYRMKKLNYERLKYQLTAGCKKQEGNLQKQDDKFKDKLENEKKDCSETHLEAREPVTNSKKKAQYDRYWKDDNYRAMKLKAARERYHLNQEYREKRKSEVKKKYHLDEQYREKVLLSNKKRYEMKKNTKGEKKSRNTRNKQNKKTMKD